MFCFKCRQEIVKIVNFCPHCGTAIYGLEQDLNGYLNKLASKTRECIITNHQLEAESKRLNKAISHYLHKLGYSNGEKILLIFDNSMSLNGKTGFAITERGFYSSGCFGLSRSHFLVREQIKVIHLNGADFPGDLVINGKATNIVQCATSDRKTLLDIVKLLLKSKGGL